MREVLVALFEIFLLLKAFPRGGGREQSTVFVWHSCCLDELVHQNYFRGTCAGPASDFGDLVLRQKNSKYLSIVREVALPYVFFAEDKPKEGSQPEGNQDMFCLAAGD